MRVAQIFNDLKNSILDTRARNEQMAVICCFFWGGENCLLTEKPMLRQAQQLKTEN